MFLISTPAARAVGLIAVLATASLAHGQLTLLSPNGSEVWQAGTTQTITWSSTGLTGTVDVSLYHLVNGEYTDGIWVGWADVEAGTLSWEVPPSLGDAENYVVQVWWTDWVDATEEDWSDAPFSITGSQPVPTITVTSPNGGEVWQAGSTYSITWDSTNPTGDVEINVLRGTGEDYEDVAYLGPVPMSDGSIDWPISPYLPDGDGYIVRILWSSPDGHVAVDSSDAPFSIGGSQPLPTITVTSPNGGEVWQAGSIQTITWQSTNTIGDVMVKWGRPYGQQQIAVVPMAAGCTSFQVPDYAGDGSDFFVLVASMEAPSEDTSDVPFSVTGSLPPPTITIISPTGGEVFPAGSTRYIRWEANAPGESAEIILLKNGQFDTSLGGVLLNDHRFAWSICPSLPDGDDYAFRLEWHRPFDNAVASFGQSESTFSIIGSQPPPSNLTLTSPLASQIIYAGTTQQITWTSQDPAGDVTIELVRGGESYQQAFLIGTAAMASGSFSWQVCDTLGDADDYHIVLLDENALSGCMGPLTTSGPDFSVSGGLPDGETPSLTITSPVAQQTLQAGTTEAIDWVSTNPQGDVTFYAQPMGSGKFVHVGSAPMTAGHLAWAIPSDLVHNKVELSLLATNGCGQILANTALGAIIVPTIHRMDFNGDGVVNALDLDAFSQCETGPALSYAAGQVPFMCQMAVSPEGTLPADLDADFDVDGEDFAILQRCLTAADAPPDAGCDK